MVKTAKPELPKKWQRFERLYCVLGYTVEECWHMLRDEGFVIAKTLGGFRSTVGMRKEKREWDAVHAVAAYKRKLLDDPAEAVRAMSLEVLFQYSQKIEKQKELSAKDLELFLRAADKVLSMTADHPKYHTKRSIGIFEHPGLNSHAVAIVIEAIRRTEGLRDFLVDPSNNRVFLRNVAAVTKEVSEGALLMDSAPKLVSGKVVNGE